MNPSGIASLPNSHCKQKLDQGWKDLLTTVLQHPVLPFNSDTARWFVALVSHSEGMGRPISTADAVIVATALAHAGQLARHNTDDFTAIGLSLSNLPSLDDRSV